ncbi:tumor protein p53-inducible nuclear protein 2 [Heterodontus francisci]|uniref:tumor protein p53-inducible nuclear protein 2 n=1 Tax=Heterodontus francisci TaxID=7792 RepID=UPI00355C9B5D
MLGRLTSFFLGEVDVEDNKENSDMNNILYENEEDDWIIVNIQVQYPVTKLEIDPLENLLIEHPSVSIYTLRNKNSDCEEIAELTEKLEGHKAITVAHYIPRRMSALIGNGGVVHTSHMSFMQRAKLHVERRKLSHNQLLRQNRAWKRHSTKDKSSRHFKQPRQRISRYSRQ